MKLIPEWKKCLKMFSVQAMVVAGAVQAAWAAVPVEWMASIDQAWLRWGTVTLMALGVAGRLIDQNIGDGNA